MGSTAYRLRRRAAKGCKSGLCCILNAHIDVYAVAECEPGDHVNSIGFVDWFCNVVGIVECVKYLHANANPNRK